MATKVFMEALSPTMEEGRLVKWLKSEGDAVKSGDVLAEVETDKAVMELAARGEGVLRKRLVNEGEAVPVGTLVGVIGAKDEDIAAVVGSAGAAKPSPAPLSQRPPQRRPQRPRKPKTENRQPRTPSRSRLRRRRRLPPRHRRPRLSPLPQHLAPAANGGRPPQPRSQNASPTKRGADLSCMSPAAAPAGRIIKRDIEAAATGTGNASTVFGPRSSVIGADFEDVPLTLIRKTDRGAVWPRSIGPIPTFYLDREIRPSARERKCAPRWRRWAKDYKVLVQRHHSQSDGHRARAASRGERALGSAITSACTTASISAWRSRPTTD